MKVIVLKPFPYARDGIHIRDLVSGAEEDILDDLVPGLVAEGFVAGKETKVVEAAPETGAAVEVEITGDVVSLPEIAAAAVSEIGSGDPYPHLTEAQETALDRDGDGAPGGSLPKAKRQPAKATRKKKVG